MLQWAGVRWAAGPAQYLTLAFFFKANVTKRYSQEVLRNSDTVSLGIARAKQPADD